MNTPKPPPQFILGSGLPPISADVDCLCLVFSRSEVESGRIGRAVDDLMCLSDSPVLANQLQHGLLIVFDGYNHDPRDIPEIPECRTYLRALHAQWPYWMHFMAPIPDQWGLLMASLLPQHGTTSHPTTHAHGTFIDPEDMTQLLKQMTDALNRLHVHLQTPVDTQRRLFHTTMDAIDQALKPSP